ISHAAIVDLIAATTTTSGLTVDCVLDPRRYAKGIKVSDEEVSCLNIEGDESTRSGTTPLLHARHNTLHEALICACVLSHTKWACKDHIVFIPKCRRTTICGELRRHLQLNRVQVESGSSRGVGWAAR